MQTKVLHMTLTEMNRLPLTKTQHYLGFSIGSKQREKEEQRKQKMKNG